MSEWNGFALVVGWWAMACCAVIVLCAVTVVFGQGLFVYIKRTYGHLRHSYDLSLVHWEMKRLKARGTIDYFLKDRDRTLPEDSKP